MKRFFAVLMLAVLATVLFVMPVLAQGETPLEPVLDPTQVVLVGIVTTVLLNVFRLIYEYARKKKWQVPELAMQGVVLAVSIGLAWLWFPAALPQLPVFTGELPDMVMAGFNYLGLLVAALAGMFGTSHFLYKLIVKGIKNGLGELFMPSVYLIDKPFGK